jgi:hypothetical protein
MGRSQVIQETAPLGIDCHSRYGREVVGRLGAPRWETRAGRTTEPHLVDGEESPVSSTAPNGAPST